MPAYGAMSHRYALVTFGDSSKRRLEPGWPEVMREVDEVIRVIDLWHDAVTVELLAGKTYCL